MPRQKTQLRNQHNCVRIEKVLNRGFNNEVQHLEKQEGACYSKWLWESNTGI